MVLSFSNGGDLEHCTVGNKVFKVLKHKLEVGTITKLNFKGSGSCEEINTTQCIILYEDLTKLYSYMARTYNLDLLRSDSDSIIVDAVFPGGIVCCQHQYMGTRFLNYRPF